MGWIADDTLTNKEEQNPLQLCLKSYIWYPVLTVLTLHLILGMLISVIEL